MANLIRKLVFALTFAMGLGSAAHAAPFPSAPVKITVVYPAGSSGDIMMRIVADSMSSHLGQPIIIENRAGGGGLVASADVARSKPDGYTLLFTGPNLITNLALYPHVPYNPLHDFSPIGVVGDVQAVLVSNPATNFKNVDDFIRYAKAHPGKINFGSAGAGTGGHLAMEMFARAAGVNIVHVPYRGASPALIDLVGGQVDIMFTGVPPTLNYISSGKLVPLVVSGRTRAPSLPNVPTMFEMGMLNYDVKIWFGLLGPAGLDQHASDVLSAALQHALGDPTVLTRLEAQGVIPNQPSPEDMAMLLRAEYDRWPAVFRELGIRAQ